MICEHCNGDAGFWGRAAAGLVQKRDALKVDNNRLREALIVAAIDLDPSGWKFEAQRCNLAANSTPAQSLAEHDAAVRHKAIEEVLFHFQVRGFKEEARMAAEVFLDSK